MDPLAAVQIKAHFDRFPATVKGAFVLHGIDGDPHQVSIEKARLTPPGEEGRSIGLEPTIVEVAPGLDVFVPFEFAIADLQPGWYGFECDAAVDGAQGVFPGGKRFCVPWSRAAVRRGTVEVAKELSGPDGRVAIEKIECGGDHSTIRVVADPPGAPTLRLTVDGAPLPVLETDVDPESGAGSVSAYPLLRAHTSMRIDLPGGDGVDVPLP
ncbi:MAG: hypothetical protein WEA10_07490 [Actinomycetota bacterium]